MTLLIRDMTEDDEYYVGTCTHENENNTEYEWSYPRRISWLRSMESKGLRVKVALLDEIHVGFLYLIPIEINPWSIKGDNLMVFPCLVAHSKFSNKGVGSELIKAAEEETIFLHRKGIVTIGYFWDFWFMPAKYFLKLGYEVAQSRGKEAILWKKFEKTANSPSFQDENYKFSLVEGKIVIDLFWNIFCQTSDVEAQRVREVVTEYGNNVILNEYSSVDQQSLQKYGINRRIYVNGKALEVGGEIEKNKLREAIESSLAKTI